MLSFCVIGHLGENVYADGYFQGKHDRRKYISVSPSGQAKPQKSYSNFLMSKRDIVRMIKNGSYSQLINPKSYVNHQDILFYI